MTETARFARLRIGIIGGGASGLLAAIHLLRAHGPKIEVAVYESQKRLGAGRAYAADDPSLLLNVPAPRMSFDDDIPDDFVRWLTVEHREMATCQHYPFVPRRLFREYLTTRLGSLMAAPEASFAHVQSRAAAVHKTGRRWRVVDEAGASRDHDLLVVATGYRPDERARSMAPTWAASIRDKIVCPYDAPRMAGIGARERVVIVGSGLTAIDAWRVLRAQGHEASLHAISRRGLVPLPHDRAGHTPLRKFPDLSGLSPLQLLQLARTFLASDDWTPAYLADHLRVQAMKVWSTWSSVERAQFARHVKPYWEVMRHRLPPTVESELQQELRNGRMKLSRGRIKAAATAADGFQLTVRAAGATEVIHADRVVIATGAEIDQAPFAFTERNMGLRICEQGFGFRVEDRDDLWILGPSAKTLYWEITSVPDIRKQVSKMVLEVGAVLSTDVATRPSASKSRAKTFALAAQLFVAACATGAQAIIPGRFDTHAGDRLRQLVRAITGHRMRNMAHARLPVMPAFKKVHREKRTG